MLRELWGLSFPEAEVRPDVPDAQWKRLGFQGNDPFTGMCLCVHAAYVCMCTCMHTCISIYGTDLSLCAYFSMYACTHACIDRSIYLSTDFRVAGVLSLHVLLHFAERYPDRYSQV